MHIQICQGVNAGKIHTPVGLFSSVAQAETAPVTLSLADVQWIAAENAHVNLRESNLPSSSRLHLVQSHLYLMLIFPYCGLVQLFSVASITMHRREETRTQEKSKPLHHPGQM